MSTTRRGFLSPLRRAALAPSVQIGAGCLARAGIVCGACADHCDARAIRMRPQLRSAPAPLVDAALCTGCGDCLAVCPVAAIAWSDGTEERGDA